MEHLDETTIRKAIAVASASEKLLLYEMLDELQARKRREEAQEKFIPFVKTIWPEFISGSHHQHMARLFEAVARGEKKRIIINLAPRHTKSEFSSYLLPAWFLGKFPKKKIMQVSNTAELAEGFGRKVRNLVGSDEYKTVFPDVGLRQDSKAAGRWNTNQGGEYFATGVGAALAGRGADICLSKLTKVIVNRNGKTVISLDKLVEGDSILTASGWEKVTRKKLTIHKNWIKINNDVEASLQHKFLTDKGWKMASGLCVGDKILTDTLWRILWRRIKQITNTLRKTLLERLGKA